ncbi:cobalt-precorrin-5B (C1)-methyltransferase [Tenacibaculum sp. MAR_2009_124]|uniref:cobalt-precorrin-5B (C(1))-methyltransferase n=1 Tax=Tenacibaculum sp. MAR_2009_124 TaxID=1250059 RepID=UPI0008962BF0|nr:cobalt-precorrin-5B (C(1))-methyltransferase [Tenacibaculum sp. MAR_2009_124]SEB86017.1 cobalt-precorrin-5B (C1)-methyltransferase [Tenacibaculum sp. MAR_2009_124]
MSELQKIPDKPLRKGYTTGACATACVKSAMLGLVTQKEQCKVTIVLPIGEEATFYLKNIQITKNSSSSTTIKDAGDDPDVTHLAEITATVELNKSKEVKFIRGEGVGLVTLPGLEIEVGEPAINPVPRKMMKTVIHKVLADHNLEECGVAITISVKDGEKLAKRTLNSRLGILHGISILGTSGIVTPFSAASYIASIRQGVDVAIANNQEELLINSGARSEKMLRNLFPEIKETACIHYGNWIRETFERIAESPEIHTVNMGIMLGKAAKLAEGNLNTHSGKTTWNKEFIAQLAKESGYSDEVSDKILSLNMAGRLREIFIFAQQEKFYQTLLKYCYKHCHRIAPKIELNLYLINNDQTHIKYNK